MPFLGFAATSTTIVSGCLAMRCRLIVYCHMAFTFLKPFRLMFTRPSQASKSLKAFPLGLFSFYAVVVYSFVAHWVWAEDGWLRLLGVHDFAGSGPVSLLGAVNGLLGIGFVGPRLGRFDGQRPQADFEPSSPPTALFGLFMPPGREAPKGLWKRGSGGGGSASTAAVASASRRAT